jgi:hypothetical protein
MIPAPAGEAAVDKHDPPVRQVNHDRFTVAWIVLGRWKKDVSLDGIGRGCKGGEEDETADERG